MRKIIFFSVLILFILSTFFFASYAKDKKEQISKKPSIEYSAEQLYLFKIFKNRRSVRKFTDHFFSPSTLKHAISPTPDIT